MQAVFANILYELEKQHDLALVTITAQEGSSPRGPGAQMLIGQSGRISGSVGGGAVEQLCQEDARECLEKRRSFERSYSLRPDNQKDIGMVCGGDVTVWIQFIDGAEEKWQRLRGLLSDMLAHNRPGWLALEADGAPAGLLNGAGECIFGSCDKQTPPLAEGQHIKTQGCFFMALPVADRAIIFGGGHCAQALAPVLNSVGFRVTVMDNRPECASHSLFPDARQVICGDYGDISKHIAIAPSDYIVIMTSGHAHDIEVQLQILRDPPAYVGVIGSRSKKAFVNKKLLEAGIPQEHIDAVHAPIGTAIKAVTPEEIAISIAGEMIYERALLREARGVRFRGCPMH